MGRRMFLSAKHACKKNHGCRADAGAPNHCSKHLQFEGLRPRALRMTGERRARPTNARSSCAGLSLRRRRIRRRAERIRQITAYRQSLRIAASDAVVARGCANVQRHAARCERAAAIGEHRPVTRLTRRDTLRRIGCRHRRVIVRFRAGGTRRRIVPCARGVDRDHVQPQQKKSTSESTDSAQHHVDSLIDKPAADSQPLTL